MSGFRLGAYKEQTRKTKSEHLNSAIRERPEVPGEDLTREKHGRKRMITPQDLFVPCEATKEKPELRNQAKHSASETQWLSRIQKKINNERKGLKPVNKTKLLVPITQTINIDRNQSEHK